MGAIPCHHVANHLPTLVQVLELMPIDATSVSIVEDRDLPLATGILAVVGIASFAAFQYTFDRWRRGLDDGLELRQRKPPRAEQEPSPNHRVIARIAGETLPFQLARSNIVRLADHSS